MRLVSAFTGGTVVSIMYWDAGGGGRLTYARWGGSLTKPFHLLARRMCTDAGEWGYRNVSSLDAFDANGFFQMDNVVFYSKYSSIDFGNNTNPVYISQQVSGLTVSRRYRLQFFQACEDGFFRPAG